MSKKTGQTGMVEAIACTFEHMTIPTDFKKGTAVCTYGEKKIE